VSYGCSHLDYKSDLAWQEYLIKAAASTMYLAGSETVRLSGIVRLHFRIFRQTKNLIAWSIIMLLNHSDILEQAQKEIDSVVPFGDLPTFDDKDKLPLITAICMEAMRLYDVTPLGRQHNSGFSL
jgi:hypothetical protein